MLNGGNVCRLLDVLIAASMQPPLLAAFSKSGGPALLQRLLTQLEGDAGVVAPDGISAAQIVAVIKVNCANGVKRSGKSNLKIGRGTLEDVVHTMLTVELFPILFFPIAMRAHLASVAARKGGSSQVLQLAGALPHARYRFCPANRSHLPACPAPRMPRCS